jgi:fructokinase
VRTLTAPVYGGIEAGGTKFVCVIGSAPDRIDAETSFPTTSPEETLGRAITFFSEYQEQNRPLAALGIGSFGPVDLDSSSQTFGYITTTPKPGWAHKEFAGRMGRALGLKVGFETDVNAAALGEATCGAARGVRDFVYLTVGTGIGGGAMVNGQLLHGLIHPEMGHLRVPHDWKEDPYQGSCSFHGDCLEGLAAGPALVGRWGQRGESLPADHVAWVLEARYLAFGITNLICTLSPKRIILGGGIMQQGALLTMIRSKVQEILNGYLHAPAILQEIDKYIIQAQLGGRAGALGALELARITAEPAATEKKGRQ